jgi:hypothetical protein
MLFHEFDALQILFINQPLYNQLYYHAFCTIPSTNRHIFSIICLIFPQELFEHFIL